MPRYHIFFKVSGDGGSHESTRIIDRTNPIEYDSDIFEIEKAVAEAFCVDKATLISWRELKGSERPTLY